MKKILALAFLIGAMVAFTPLRSDAQLAKTGTALTRLNDQGTTHVATLINVDTVNLVATAPDNIFSQSSLEIFLTKVSGTVAGNYFFQHTVDGTNWFTDSTAALANANNNLKYVPKDQLYIKARIRLIGSGTANSTISGAVAYFKRINEPEPLPIAKVWKPTSRSAGSNDIYPLAIYTINEGDRVPPFVTLR